MGLVRDESDIGDNGASMEKERDKNVRRKTEEMKGLNGKMRTNIYKYMYK